MKTITLRLTDGEVVWVNVDRIDSFGTANFGSIVYVGGAERPFCVKETCADIFDKIEKVEVNHDQRTGR